MKVLIKANELQAVALAASTETMRYYLKGVCFEDNGGMIATDGHRMHTIRAQVKAEVKDSFILGNDDIKKVLALYKPIEKEHKPIREKLRICIEHDKGALKISIVMAEGDSVSLGGFDGKAVDGNFPDWRRVLPSGEPEPITAIGINTNYVADFGKANSLLAGFKAPNIKLEFYGDTTPMLIEIAEYDFLGALMPVRVNMVG